MPVEDLLEEMHRYYEDRVPFHDVYMGYTDAAAMERLLDPIVAYVGAALGGRDVLEVACGTGNWTQVLARRCRTVVATDLIEGYLERARAKVHAPNVTFRRADAYSLEGVGEGFSAAFSADWWSHMPRSRVPVFLDALHARLRPGARVVVLDMLRTPELDAWPSSLDEEGNVVQRRGLPSGDEYLVVKNFPTAAGLRADLGGRAVDVEHVEFPGLARWLLAYTPAPPP